MGGNPGKRKRNGAEGIRADRFGWSKLAAHTLWAGPQRGSGLGDMEL